jgi:hypothetical protein
VALECVGNWYWLKEAAGCQPLLAHAGKALGEYPKTDKPAPTQAAAGQFIALNGFTNGGSRPPADLAGGNAENYLRKWRASRAVAPFALPDGL